MGTFVSKMKIQINILIFFVLNVVKGQIVIPSDDCRWITAPDFGDDLKCDGNEVAVGSCSGGGSFGQKDCPGNTVHQLKCCAMPEFYYSDCDTYNPDECTWEYGGYGQMLECGRSDEVLVGRCGSGSKRDCPGDSSHGNLCCQLVFL